MNNTQTITSSIIPSRAINTLNSTSQIQHRICISNKINEKNRLNKYRMQKIIISTPFS